MTKRRVVRELTIEEISGVTRPANAEATVAVMKGAGGLAGVADYLEGRLASLTAAPSPAAALELKELCKAVVDHQVETAGGDALYKSADFNRVYAVMGAAESRACACNV